MTKPTSADVATALSYARACSRYYSTVCEQLPRREVRADSTASNTSEDCSTDVVDTLSHARACLRFYSDICERMGQSKGRGASAEADQEQGPAASSTCATEGGEELKASKFASIIEMLPATASKYSASEIEDYIGKLANDALPYRKAHRTIKQDMGILKCVSCREIKPFACFHVKKRYSEEFVSRHSECSKCGALKKRVYREACAAAAMALMPSVKLTRSGNVAGGTSYKRLRETSGGGEQ